jgi:hypothetical protein
VMSALPNFGMAVHRTARSSQSAHRRIHPDRSGVAFNRSASVSGPTDPSPS